MGYRRKLFSVKNPFDTENTKEIFLAAVKENCEFQYKNCPEYKKILDSMGFSPSDLKTYEDIAKIPPIPTLFFKSHKIYSMPKNKFFITATSSGTSGKFSEIGFDFLSLLNGLSVEIFKQLIKIEPAMKNFIYVFDTPSSDVSAMKKMADISDGIVVWGGDSAVKAVRTLAPAGAKIIEWGHKLGFAYVSGYEDKNAELTALHTILFQRDSFFADPARRFLSTPRTSKIWSNSAMISCRFLKKRHLKILSRR